MTDSYEEIYDDEDDEKENHGNIVVKFFVLLFLGVMLYIILGMFIGFILRSLRIELTGYIDIMPLMTLLVGIVFGYIIRDFSLRKSKN